MNNNELLKKALSVTGLLLKEKGYISFVDVFMILGFLDQKDYEDWRRRRVPYLEKVITVNLKKINLVMKAIRKNCLNENLKPSWTGYSSWGKGAKTRLWFSKSGEMNIENLYATHFVMQKESGAGKKSS